MLRREIGDDIDLRADRESDECCGCGLGEGPGAVQKEQDTSDDGQQEGDRADQVPRKPVQQQAGAETAEN